MSLWERRESMVYPKHSPGKALLDLTGSALRQTWELKLHLHILNIFCGSFNLKQILGSGWNKRKPIR